MKSARSRTKSSKLVKKNKHLFDTLGLLVTVVNFRSRKQNIPGNLLFCRTRTLQPSMVSISPVVSEKIEMYNLQKTTENNDDRCQMMASDAKISGISSGILVVI